LPAPSRGQRETERVEREKGVTSPMHGAACEFIHGLVAGWPAAYATLLLLDFKVEERSEGGQDAARRLAREPFYEGERLPEIESGV